MNDGLIRRALDVNWRNLALGHQVFSTSGATFVRNPAFPDVYDANFVCGVTASKPAEIDTLLIRASEEYPYAARLTFRVDPFTPFPFEARLAFEGYERTDAILLALEGPVLGTRRPVEIRAIDDQTAWREYAELKTLDWQEYSVLRNFASNHGAIAEQLASASKLKSPPVHYVLAYQDGRAVGHCCAWEGMDNVGQVEDVFVHAEYRRRGIATAMIHVCAETARSRGARAIVIVVDSKNSAKHLYSALGWQPVALCREYGKKLSHESL